MTQASSIFEASVYADVNNFNHCILGKRPEVLKDVYLENTNIVIWQRKLSNLIAESSECIIKTNPDLQISQIVSPQDAYPTMNELLGYSKMSAILSNDIAELVDMFCLLFGLNQAGIRLTVLNSAMCPKFHVDRVPCRLITTYHGIATEWLPHGLANRTKLGHGSQGKPDHESGLINSLDDIQQLRQGEVALLKGETWDGNQGAGLIHRSPMLTGENNRLLLTIDFINQ